jgi:hypothetical protein
MQAAFAEQKVLRLADWREGTHYMRIVVVKHLKRLAAPPTVSDSRVPLALDDAEIRRWRQENAIQLNDALAPVQSYQLLPSWQCEACFAAIESQARVYFTSKYTHAWETGRLIAQMLGDDPETVRTLWSLTPWTPPWEGPLTFGHVADELEAEGIALDSLEVVIFAGHEARLSQLRESLTSRPYERLQHGEVACVEGSLEACRNGMAISCPRGVSSDER